MNQLPYTTKTLLRLIKELHGTYKNLNDGDLASYIPELAKANPKSFGISITTVKGETIGIGDQETPFTLQSISKPLIFGLALEDHGREFVRTRVGAEPTGEPFHSVIRLDSRSKRPYNPMVNTGAIAMTSLIKGDTPKDKLKRMLHCFEGYTGHKMTIDKAVFLSEKATGHRNRAIAHLMLHFGMVDANIDETLDLYFQQCSTLVTCRDLSLMAATLANYGVNPITQKRVIAIDYIKDLLTLMFTCGLYTYAGEWAYTVGLPAKSGVCGGIMVVVPGQMGIGVYSPRIDHHGNSVRGLYACRGLSNRLGLHIFQG